MKALSFLGFIGAVAKPLQALFQASAHFCRYATNQESTKSNKGLKTATTSGVWREGGGDDKRGGQCTAVMRSEDHLKKVTRGRPVSADTSKRV